MEHSTRLRFEEDRSKLSSSRPELAPASDSSQAYLSRQHHQQAPIKNCSDPKAPHGNGGEDASTNSQQVRVRCERCSRVAIPPVLSRFIGVVVEDQTESPGMP